MRSFALFLFLSIVLACAWIMKLLNDPIIYALAWFTFIAWIGMAAWIELPAARLRDDIREVLMDSPVYRSPEEVAGYIGALRASRVSRFRTLPPPGYEAEKHTPPIEKVVAALLQMDRRGKLENLVRGYGLKATVIGYRLPQPA